MAGTFDVELIHAICATKALDQDLFGGQLRFTGERLVSVYHFTRTMTDHDRKHELTSLILDSVGYILSCTNVKDEESKAVRARYIHLLCLATVQTCSKK